MTMMTIDANRPAFQELVSPEEAYDGTPDPILIDETYWGYIIRRTTRRMSVQDILMVLSGVLGFAFIFSSLGMWLISGGGVGVGAFSMKLGLSVLWVAIGVQLILYSRRGGVTELQIDNRLGEIRQMIRRRSGRVIPVSRYGYDSISSVFLHRDAGGPDEAAIMLRFHHTNSVVQAAIGPVVAVEALLQRMGRDLLVRPQQGEGSVDPDWKSKDRPAAA